MIVENGELGFEISVLGSKDDFIIITQYNRVTPEAKIKQWKGMTGSTEAKGT